MYIGPWQEYKLAQVIKTKNDLYEQNLETRSLKHTSTQDSVSISQASNASTPSTRTLSSEPIQRPFPKFAIDKYYEQWRKVENLMSQPSEVHKKPPLPKVQARKRQGKSIQERRVNQMRTLYGFNKPTNPVPQTNESQKVSFVDKLKNKVRESEKIEEKNERKDELKNEIFKTGVRNNAEGYSSTSFSGREEEKSRMNDDVNKENWEISVGVMEEPERTPEKRPDFVESGKKFTCLASINEMDALEESINHEGVDGLLQWVENLPDEASSTLRYLPSPEPKFPSIKL